MRRAEQETWSKSSWGEHVAQQVKPVLMTLFNPWNPDGGRREVTPTSCPLNPTYVVCCSSSPPTHWERRPWGNLQNLFVGSGAGMSETVGSLLFQHLVRQSTCGRHNHEKASSPLQASGYHAVVMTPQTVSLLCCLCICLLHG